MIALMKEVGIKQAGSRSSFAGEYGTTLSMTGVARHSGGTARRDEKHVGHFPPSWKTRASTHEKKNLTYLLRRSYNSFSMMHAEK
jgi:hypothetical protein